MSGSAQRPMLLYVEDDDASVFLLQTALKEAHLDVQLSRVCNGEEALAWLNHFGTFADSPRPDLVLLDLNLPRKSGLEVLAEIHSDTSLCSIPIIVFSSSNLETDRRQSLELGARDYIKKPSTFAAFVDVIRAVCAFLPS